MAEVPPAFSGTLCYNETTLVSYVDGAITEVVSSEGPCGGLTPDQIELTVGILLGIAFGIFWLVGAFAALFVTYKTHRKKRAENVEQTSMVRERLAMFEGTTTELEGYDQTIRLLGDAQCLAAELALRSMDLTQGATFGTKMLYYYRRLMFFLVRSGLYNAIYVYELFVLSAFIFMDSINWGMVTVSDNLPAVLGWLSFEIDSMYIFWGTVAAYGLLAMMAAIRYFGYRSEVYKDILNKFYALLLFILLIPAMKVCMEQLDCVYRDPSVPYVYLQNNPSIQCFHGLHILNTVIAVIFIFGMYAAALIYIVYIRKNISDFIRFNATFEIVLLAGKALLNVIDVFFGSLGNGLLQLIVVLLVMLVFVSANFWVQPCRGKGAIPNSVRTGVYLSCVYGCCCAFAALFINAGIPKADGGNTAPLIAYFAGVVPVILIGFFINYPRARPLTIPDKSFRELLLDPNEKTRNMAALAVSVSKVIDLSSSGIEDKHMKLIAEGVKSSKSLKQLSLADNKIGGSGMKVLAEALKTNKSVKYLDMSRNYIGVEGSRYAADMIRKHTVLEQLFLDRNGLRDEGSKTVCNAIKKHDSLIVLSLCGNYISNEAVPTMLEVVKSNMVLQWLILDDNKISAENLTLITTTLDANAPAKSNKYNTSLSVELRARRDSDARNLLSGKRKTYLSLVTDDPSSSAPESSRSSTLVRERVNKLSESAGSSPTASSPDTPNRTPPSGRKVDGVEGAPSVKDRLSKLVDSSSASSEAINSNSRTGLLADTAPSPVASEVSLAGDRNSIAMSEIKSSKQDSKKDPPPSSPSVKDRMSKLIDGAAAEKGATTGTPSTGGERGTLGKDRPASVVSQAPPATPSAPADDEGAPLSVKERLRRMSQANSGSSSQK